MTFLVSDFIKLFSFFFFLISLKSQIVGLSFTYGVFCSLAICACTLIFFVPETRSKNLPDTLNDCLKKKETGDEKEKEKLTEELDKKSTSV